MRLTLSKTGLAGRCVHFARPDVPEQRREVSIYARKGIALHAMIEHDGEPPRDVWAGIEEADADEVRGWYWSWLESPLSDEAWQHEVAIAIDPRAGSARLLDTKGRDYSGVGPHEIPGTLDLVRVEDDRVVVVDIKTGQQAHTEPAATNTQLHNYALGICRATGRDAALVIVAMIDENGVFETRAELDGFDLVTVETELVATLDAIPEARPQPGMHCRELWCPALAVCPATRQATQLLAPGDPIPVDLASQPDAVLESVIARVKTIRSLCDHVEESVRAEADTRGGIALGDGRVWGRYVDVIEPIAADHPEAPSILARHGVEGAVVTKVSVAKTDLEAAFRDQGKKVTPSMRGLMDELRAVGATRPHEQAKYEARKPKATKASA
jgi:hypothetical protein